MDKNLLSEWVSKLARLRNVDVEYVYETLRLSIEGGLKRRFGRNVKSEVIIDREKNDIRIYIYKRVVTRVVDAVSEIQIEDAKKYRKDVKEGEDVKIEIPLSEIGRLVIQKAGDELSYRLRRREQDKIYLYYKERLHTIVSGTVHKKASNMREEAGTEFVNLGSVVAILPVKDQIRADSYQQGVPYKFYITRVDKTPIGTKVFLSRTKGEFLKRLLEREVPEIRDNVIEIKGVVRQPGVRAKVAVYTEKEHIDPIGACVGYRRSRIMSITKELSGEKIDVVLWSNDTVQYVANALSPAKIKKVIKEETSDAYIAIVEDEEFSKAVGRKGQNVWLASLLTGTKIEIFKESDYKDYEIAVKFKNRGVETLDLDDETIKFLRERGYINVHSIFSLTTLDLANALEWTPEEIDQLKDAIRESLEGENGE